MPAGGAQGCQPKCAHRQRACAAGREFARSWSRHQRSSDRALQCGRNHRQFGTNGLVTLPNCVPICQRALLAVDASGWIYTEGGANALIRLNPDGSIDGSYASVPIAP